MESMAHTWQPAADTLTRDLGGIFRGRLLSLVVYGGQVDGNATAPLQSLALVSSLTADDLEACAHLSAEWIRGGIGTPLILPDTEFRASLDVFPLEYGEILRAHTLVYGADPFLGVTISPGDLRLVPGVHAHGELPGAGVVRRRHREESDVSTHVGGDRRGLPEGRNAGGADQHPEEHGPLRHHENVSFRTRTGERNCRIE